MTATPLVATSPGAVPAVRSVRAAPDRAWTAVPGALLKRIDLDRGNVLRIRDGRGLQLTAASGVLWIAEERSVNDTVLQPGDTHRIGNGGVAMVLAHRGARVVMEVPAGTPLPRRVELAPTEGSPGRVVARGGRAQPARRPLATIAAALRKAFAALRHFRRES